MNIFWFFHAAGHVTSILVSIQALQLYNIPLPGIDQPLYHLPGSTPTLSTFPVFWVGHHAFPYDESLQSPSSFCARCSDDFGAARKAYQTRFANHSKLRTTNTTTLFVCLHGPNWLNQHSTVIDASGEHYYSSFMWLRLVYRSLQPQSSAPSILCPVPPLLPNCLQRTFHLTSRRQTCPISSIRMRNHIVYHQSLKSSKIWTILCKL